MIKESLVADMAKRQVIIIRKDPTSVDEPNAIFNQPRCIYLKSDDITICIG